MSDEVIAEQAAAIVAALPKLMRQLFTLDVDDPVLELPVAQLRVCSILHEGPRTMSALSRELGISVSATCQPADRLERANMVERVAQTQDRRVKTRAANGSRGPDNGTSPPDTHRTDHHGACGTHSGGAAEYCRGAPDPSRSVARRRPCRLEHPPGCESRQPLSHPYSRPPIQVGAPSRVRTRVVHAPPVAPGRVLLPDLAAECTDVDLSEVTDGHPLHPEIAPLGPRPGAGLLH